MLPTRGRAPAPMTISVVRELTQEDLLRLATEPTQRAAPPILQRLRAPHHAAARLLAAGKDAKEVAILVGRTPQRIRDLQVDPAFKELVAYYADQITEAEIADAARLRSKLVTLAEDAVDELQERMDDDEKRLRLPAGELRQIAEMGLDRTVAPPKTAVPGATTPTHITFNIAGTIDRPLQAAEQRVIEHKKSGDTNAETQKDEAQTPPQADGDSRPSGVSGAERAPLPSEDEAKGK